MKQLSLKAQKYLESLSRDKDWCVSKEEVLQYLEKQNLGIFKPIARFESNYSGYDLIINSLPAENFFLRLFTKDDVKENFGINFISYNGYKLFDCGYHQTAQYNFYLNDQGAIMIELSDDYYLELYSSVEIMVEIYAFFSSFSSDIYQTKAYHIKDFDSLMLTLLYGDFKEIKDCCDKQNQILCKGKMTVYLSPVWDMGDVKCVRIFGYEKKQCESLISSLQKENLIW